MYLGNMAVDRGNEAFVDILHECLICQRGKPLSYKVQLPYRHPLESV
jgi:hypothetical protein